MGLYKRYIHKLKIPFIYYFFIWAPALCLWKVRSKGHRAFRYNLFAPKRQAQKVFPLQSLARSVNEFRIYFLKRARDAKGLALFYEEKRSKKSRSEAEPEEARCPEHT
jgi:hypothetical protein